MDFPWNSLGFFTCFSRGIFVDFFRGFPVVFPWNFFVFSRGIIVDFYGDFPWNSRGIFRVFPWNFGGSVSKISRGINVDLFLKFNVMFCLNLSLGFP